MINYDEAAEAYAANRKIHTGVFRALLESGTACAGQCILEVGCGTGNYIIALQELTGCDARGIDPSEGMLQKAKERTTTVQFLPGRGEDIPYVDEHFDLVYSVDVIHHIQDRAKYYQEAMRVLKPGGMVCTATDSEEIIRNRPILAGYFPETVEVELKRYPPIDELRQLMSAAGFSWITSRDVEMRVEVTDIRAYREKAFSSLHLISEEAFQRGIQRLEADLARGPVTNLSRYTMLWGTRKLA